MKTTTHTCKKDLPKKSPCADGPQTMLRYLTTPEAAKYLRKSASWLLRQGDIAYIPGRPNTYQISDLDDWAERHKTEPLR